MKKEIVMEIETIVVDPSVDIIRALMLVGIAAIAGNGDSHRHEKKDDSSNMCGGQQKIPLPGKKWPLPGLIYGGGGDFICCWLMLIISQTILIIIIIIMRTKSDEQCPDANAATLTQNGEN